MPSGLGFVGPAAWGESYRVPLAKCEGRFGASTRRHAGLAGVDERVRENGPTGSARVRASRLRHIETCRPVARCTNSRPNPRSVRSNSVYGAISPPHRRPRQSLLHGAPAASTPSTLPPHRVPGAADGRRDVGPPSLASLRRSGSLYACALILHPPLVQSCFTSLVLGLRAVGTPKPRPSQVAPRWRRWGRTPSSSCGSSAAAPSARSTR